MRKIIEERMHTKSKYVVFLTWLLSIWAAMIGLRFITGYFHGNAYQFVLFDVFFDWGILFLLGFVVLLSSICSWHRNIKGRKIHIPFWKEVKFT